MKAVLPRTGSVPVLMPVQSGSLRMGLSRHDSVSGIFSGERSASSPKISMNLEMNNKKISGIRRALSESDILGSQTDVFASFTKVNGTGSRYVPSRIPEEVEHVSDVDAEDYGSFNRLWPEDTIPLGGNYDNTDGDEKKIGDYYRELLKSNPTDSLLLRNYGKYLHEVINYTILWYLKISLSYHK